MKDNNRKHEEDLFRIWDEAARSNESQNFTKMEIEKTLSKASHEMAGSFQKGIYFDMALKSILMAGFIGILVYSLTNHFVLITSLIFIVVAGTLLFFEWKMLRNFNEVQKKDMSIKGIIEQELRFYNTHIIKYPLFLSFSMAMFFVLGSMIYHGIVYGYIRPIKDMTDAIVLTSFMLAGIIISVVANLPYFTGRIKQLDELLRDVENPEVYAMKLQKLKIKKQRDFLLYTIIAIAGILLLAFILVHLSA